jgi:hypothetical protein
MMAECTIHRSGQPESLSIPVHNTMIEVDLLNFGIAAAHPRYATSLPPLIYEKRRDQARGYSHPTL